jgi:hypothetical protein
MTEDELLQEIETRRAAGARGIKLHPAAQRFYPNDERLAPVYAGVTELEWPVIFHSGAFALGPGSTTQASLENFPPLLKSFPKLTIVLGHMGFGEFDTCAAIAADFPNAMFDCCFAVNGTEPTPAISDEEAAAGFRKVGVDRVMFGSDYPWLDPSLDAARIERLPLSDTEKRAVLRDNAARVFGLNGAYAERPCRGRAPLSSHPRGSSPQSSTITKPARLASKLFDHDLVGKVGIALQVVLVDIHSLPHSKLPDHVGELVAYSLDVGAEPDARPVLRTAVPRGPV